MEPLAKRICGFEFSFHSQPLREVRDEVSVLLKRATIFSGLTVHHEGDADDTTWVARSNDGTIVGVCLFTGGEENMGSTILYVAKKWRRRGLATVLIKKVLEGKTALMGKVYDLGAELRSIMKPALDMKNAKDTAEEDEDEDEEQDDEECKEEKDDDDDEDVNIALFCKSLGAHITYTKDYEFIWTLISPTAKFVRLMTRSEKHESFQYQDGLNVDDAFSSKRIHRDEGLHFCTPRDIKRWLLYFNDPRDDPNYMVWVREVSLPPDAKVIRSAKDAFRADKIVLGKRMAIPDWLAENAHLIENEDN